MSEQMATSRAGTDAIIALARAEALAALVQHQRQRVDQILAAAKAGAPIEVCCPPSEGAHFRSAAFERVWRGWFPPSRDTGVPWFEGTPVASTMDSDYG